MLPVTNKGVQDKKSSVREKKDLGKEDGKKDQRPTSAARISENNRERRVVNSRLFGHLRRRRKFLVKRGGEG